MQSHGNLHDRHRRTVHFATWPGGLDRLRRLLSYQCQTFSVRRASEDSILCDLFARNAVHAAMDGKTELVIGFLH